MKQIGGIALGAMILFSVAADLVQAFSASPNPTSASNTVLTLLNLLAGAAACIAVVALFNAVRSATRIQVGVLLAIGLVLLGAAMANGYQPDVIGLISRNTLLLSMIMSVGFLRLVLNGDTRYNTAATGKRGLLHTLLAISLFGSVINISAPLIIGDALTRHRTMDRMTGRVLTRMFTACAAWSPYFAGMAVVLIYVPGVRLPVLLMFGLPFLVLAFVVVYLAEVRLAPESVDDFRGYPMSVQSLLVPFLLSLLVIVGFYLLPRVSILTIITVSALVLTSLFLMRRGNVPSTVDSLWLHVREGLPLSVNELYLFMTAGVLASGLMGILDAGLLQFSVETFSAATAIGLLAVMIVIAASGIHPVVQIAGITPLVISVAPGELLAMTYLFAWSLGTCASPLSGTNLVFQARYGIPAGQGARANWPYVAVMYSVACLLLAFLTRLT